MSYGIIFEDKIIKLDNGMLLQVERFGCNNDDSGRTKDDFTGKLWKYEDYIEEATKHINNKDTYSDFYCCIGNKNRPKTEAEYGMHLLYILKRAKTYDDFIKKNRLYAHVMRGWYVTKDNETKYYPVNEIENIWYKLEVPYSIRYDRERYDNIEQIINGIKNKEPLTITCYKRPEWEKR